MNMIAQLVEQGYFFEVYERADGIIIATASKNRTTYTGRGSFLQEALDDVKNVMFISIQAGLCFDDFPTPEFKYFRYLR